jgi:thiamine biosynthesis lipoprotein
LLFAALIASGCEPSAIPIELNGHTQGTSYSIREFCRSAQPRLDAEVERALDDIVAMMSTYDPDSTLSRFNASEPGEWYDVPPALAQVLAAAQQLARLSGGAFDVTVGPLVNAWGFGPGGGERGAVPSSESIAAARARIGFRRLDVRLMPPGVRKRLATYVDLSAIAQGYTTDVVGALLDRRGCPSYMIDIGGEVRVGVRKPNGELWRIAIDAPEGSSADPLILMLENSGVSTSGDYRDFFEVAHRRYSHTMDPRVGAPIEHDLAAVTVIDASAMWADGFATALNVLGPIDGPAFAAEHGIAALFIERTANGCVRRETPTFTAAAAQSRR